MSKATSVLSQTLILAASSIGDTLNQSGLDSEKFGFTLVLWPIGEPARCSSICGSGHPDGQGESTLALKAASEKTKGTPTMTAYHGPKPN